MTVRETYAGMFMQGLIESSSSIFTEVLSDATYALQAKLAVRMADAVIEELNKDKK